MNWLLYVFFNFVLYSFLGWVVEEVYFFLLNGCFKEEGFLNIPFKPMYGIAICILIYSYYRLEVSKISLAFLCMIIPTLVEFISGYLLRHIFHEEYWSYHNLKFNFQGLISLKFSIYWTVLSFVAILYIQPLIQKLYIKFNSLSNMLAIILLIYIILDFIDIGSIKFRETVLHHKNYSSFNNTEIKERTIKKNKV